MSKLRDVIYGQPLNNKLQSYALLQTETLIRKFLHSNYVLKCLDHFGLRPLNYGLQSISLKAYISICDFPQLSSWSGKNESVESFASLISSNCVKFYAKL